MTVSTRADIITRRTYCRPTNEEGTEFETWVVAVVSWTSYQIRIEGTEDLGAQENENKNWFYF